MGSSPLFDPLFPLLAHVETGAAAGLLSGLSHPISGLDHVIAMIAVGLWGAQLGRPAVWTLPVAFPMMMACGGFLGLLGVPLPGVELAIATSAFVLGLMVLLEARPPPWVATIVVGFFALFHGHAHGTELPPGANGTLYSIGFVVSTGLLHACGIAIGLLHGFGWGGRLVRLAGGFVMAGGLFFLWQCLA